MPACINLHMHKHEVIQKHIQMHIQTLNYVNINVNNTVRYTINFLLGCPRRLHYIYYAKDVFSCDIKSHSMLWTLKWGGRVRLWHALVSGPYGRWSEWLSSPNEKKSNRLLSLTCMSIIIIEWSDILLGEVATICAPKESTSDDIVIIMVWHF